MGRKQKERNDAGIQMKYFSIIGSYLVEMRLINALYVEVFY